MRRSLVSWGKGETKAVFLHGFAGGASSFAHLEPLLGDVLSARCLELPGHGRTPPASWDATVDALGAMLEPRTVLIGYSQGARVALAVAAKYPDRVERLVLESGAAGLRRRHDRALRRRADEALAELLLSRGVEAFMSQWEQRPLFAGLRALPAIEQEALRSRRVNHSPEGLAAALRSLGQGAQPDLWPKLQGLRIPTLLLTGANDTRYTRLARLMTADLPLAWRASFRGVGHAPHLECPALYAAEVRGFLAPSWLSEPREHAP